MLFIVPQKLRAWAESSRAPKRKFYSILSLGRIGFHASFLESVDLAAKYGFEGLDPDANYFASFDNDALKRLLDDLAQTQPKVWCGWITGGIPQRLRYIQRWLEKTPPVAATLQRSRELACNYMGSAFQATISHTRKISTSTLSACGSVRRFLPITVRNLDWNMSLRGLLLRSQKYQFIHNLRNEGIDRRHRHEKRRCSAR